ncbi:unannotated protein [freshwater metagenome]|uniref:Unannotated protein n=1 Tax=freshwater metagenome TaxID=449393 RepID=A0A6J6ACB4_9ZZZZ
MCTSMRSCSPLANSRSRRYRRLPQLVMGPSGDVDSTVSSSNSASNQMHVPSTIMSADAVRSTTKSVGSASAPASVSRSNSRIGVGVPKLAATDPCRSQICSLRPVSLRPANGDSRIGPRSMPSGSSMFQNRRTRIDSCRVTGSTKRRNFAGRMRPCGRRKRSRTSSRFWTMFSLNNSSPICSWRTTSTGSGGVNSRLFACTNSMLVKPLWRPISRAMSMTSECSTAYTFFAPARLAMKASRPVPVPRSTTTSPGRTLRRIPRWYACTRTESLSISSCSARPAKLVSFIRS